MIYNIIREDNRSEYVLKHKDIDVAVIILNSNGRLIDVKEHIHPEHYPMGIVRDDGNIIVNNLYEWWDSRGLPKTRDMINDILKEIGETDRNKLLISCNGLSLSDHYWIINKNENIKWKDINFYENNFNNDIGNLFFYKKKENRKYDLRCPDITSGGNLRKKWVIEKDGKRVLIKGGKKPYFQEPANEVIATIICKRLNIPHVPYTLLKENKEVVCRCINITDKGTELIHASDVYASLSPNINDNLYKHYLKCIHNLKTDKINETKIIKMLDRMFVLDYLMYNHDRHFANFGILRDSETLECKGPSPIYDTGSSLFHENSKQLMFEKDRHLEKDHCFDTLEKQLSLVTDWTWYNGCRLKNIGEECMDVYSKISTIEKERAKKIIEIMEKRIELLNATIDKKKLIIGRTNNKKNIR
jgi:hypothetical protein